MSPIWALTWGFSAAAGHSLTHPSPAAGPAALACCWAACCFCTSSLMGHCCIPPPVPCMARRDGWWWCGELGGGWAAPSALCMGQPAGGLAPPGWGRRCGAGGWWGCWWCWTGHSCGPEAPKLLLTDVAASDELTAPILKNGKHIDVLVQDCGNSSALEGGRVNDAVDILPYENLLPCHVRLSVNHWIQLEMVRAGRKIQFKCECEQSGPLRGKPGASDMDISGKSQTTALIHGYPDLSKKQGVQRTTTPLSP